MKQITKEDWAEVAGDIGICTLPYSVSYIENNYDVSFFEFEAEGLGICFGMYGQIEDIKYFFVGHLNRENTELGVTVFVRSFERAPLKALSSVCNYFNIDKSKLIWINEELQPPRWGVFTKNNSEEIETYRFQTRKIAEIYANKNLENTQFSIREIDID